MQSGAQSCLTLCDPMDCSLPDSSVHGISQAWILEWVAISFSGDLPDHRPLVCKSVFCFLVLCPIVMVNQQVQQLWPGEYMVTRHSETSGVIPDPHHRLATENSRGAS